MSQSRAPMPREFAVALLIMLLDGNNALLKRCEKRAQSLRAFFFWGGPEGA